MIGSALPSTSNSVSNVSLSSIQFKEQFLRLYVPLTNRVHGYDDIGIYKSIKNMWLFNCEASIDNFQKLFICKLGLFLTNGICLMSIHKNSYLWIYIPIHKKGYKQLLQNYCPVLLLLLPICSKISGKIIFNPMLDFLEENSLLGFCLSDLYQSQLLSIVHDIYASCFDLPLKWEQTS